MKKKIITFILLIIVFLITSSVIFNYSEEKENNLIKVKLAEVAHSIFYAPQYVAINNGYFLDEGLDIELILTPGADKVASSILSGDVDIGLSGSETTIYVYNQGEKDYLKTFAELTQKDGSFIVSRKKINNFSLNDLKGKYIIGGRIGGMPEMTLEYILTKNGINPEKDLTIDTSIAFASMQASFISGIGDFVSLFEPNATEVCKEGYGYIVLSLGELGGNVPYTAYNARISYLEENPNIIEKFTKAIQKGLDFVNTKTSEEIANCIINSFPDSNLEDLITAIEHYKENNTWPLTTNFTEESFDLLQDIMINANQLDKKVSFNDLVYKINK